MSKGLKELKRLPNAIKDTFKDSFDIIKKELKAFKFVKNICNLKVYKNKLGQCFIEGTHILFSISQEKYDLLKKSGL